MSVTPVSMNQIAGLRQANAADVKATQFTQALERRGTGATSRADAPELNKFIGAIKTQFSPGGDLFPKLA